MTHALPLLPDGTLPPAMVLLRWLVRVGENAGTVFTLDHLPPGNGSIPDLLVLAGFRQLQISAPHLDKPFRWQGCGGADIAVNGAGTSDPLHQGHVPCSAPMSGNAGPLLALADLARFEDASGVRGLQSSGAAWDDIFEALGVAASPQRSTPAIEPSVLTRTPQWCAWNSLPFARHTLVTSPTVEERMYRGLRDDRGARFPVQIIDGPSGKEMLSSLELGALEGRRFEGIHEDVPGCYWEVTTTVIDNGRVRAEIDSAGRLMRICCAGHFIDVSGPAFHPRCNDQDFSGAAVIVVRESGPVRARIDVTRTTTQGILTVSYMLHAHEDLMRVSAQWQGDGIVTLNIPTLFISDSLVVAGDAAPWIVDQAEHASGRVQMGVRWATLGEHAGGKGIMLAAARPLALTACAGRISIHVQNHLVMCVGSCARMNGVSPLQIAQSLAITACSSGLSEALDPGLRCDGRLTPCWIRRPEGWTGELLLADVTGVRGTTTLYVAGAGSTPSNSVRRLEAWRVDAAGNAMNQLAMTPECDAVLIDHRAYDMMLIRWRII